MSGAMVLSGSRCEDCKQKRVTQEIEFNVPLAEVTVGHLRPERWDEGFTSVIDLVLCGELRGPYSKICIQ